MRRLVLGVQDLGFTKRAVSVLLPALGRCGLEGVVEQADGPLPHDDGGRRSGGVGALR